MNQLTIICAIYNMEQYLQECLDSFANQSCKDFDLILVDDCSKDKSDEIVRKFIAEHKDITIKYLRNDTNHGVSYSWERGILAAETPWYYIVDADDAIHPLLVEKILPVLAQEKESTVITGGYFAVQEYEKNEWSNLSLTNLTFQTIAGDLESKASKVGFSVGKSFTNKKLFAEVDYEKYKDLFPRYYLDDGLFSTLLYRQADCIKRIEQNVYLYRLRDGSEGTSIKSMQTLMDNTRSAEELIKELLRLGENAYVERVWSAYANQLMKIYYAYYANHCEDTSILTYIDEKEVWVAQNVDFTTRSKTQQMNQKFFTKNHKLWYLTLGKAYFKYGQRILRNIGKKHYKLVKVIYG